MSTGYLVCIYIPRSALCLYAVKWIITDNLTSCLAPTLIPVAHWVASQVAYEFQAPRVLWQW